MANTYEEVPAMGEDTRSRLMDIPVLAEYEAWLSLRSNHQLNVRNCAYYCRKAATWLAGVGKTLDGAKLADLEGFMHTLSRLSPGSRRFVRRALVKYYEFQQDRGTREDNPALGLPNPRPKKYMPKPIPKEVLPAIFAAAKRHNRPLFWECLLTTFLWTGFRHTEVTTLRWAAVRNDYFVVVQKGGNERTVFLAEPVMEVLARWRKEAPDSPFVFPAAMKPSTPICASTVWRTVHRFGREAGLEHLHVHQFRHTFATTLLEATNNVAVVQKALGHASIQNTMTYAEVNPKGLREAVETLTYGTDPALCTEQSFRIRRLNLEGLLKLLDEDTLSRVAGVLDQPNVLSSLERACDGEFGRFSRDLTKEQVHGYIRLLDLRDDMFKWERRWWCNMYVLAALAIVKSETPNYSAIVMEATRVTDRQAEAQLFVE